MGTQAFWDQVISSLQPRRGVSLDRMFWTEVSSYLLPGLALVMGLVGLGLVLNACFGKQFRSQAK